MDASVGLNGIIHFLLCRSPTVSIPTAPAVVLVEVKKGDIASGYGQCIAEMVAAMPEKVLESVVARVPQRRLGTPNEIARGVVFLCQDGEYITGQQLNINGGLYM